MKRPFLKTESFKMSSGSKRARKFSFSEDDDHSMDSKVRNDDSPPLSKIYNSACRNNKPAELFRKDLISAMKLPDSEQLDPDDFWFVSDSWKQEWERGVQVPVNSKNVPVPHIKETRKKNHRSNFKLPKKLIRSSEDNFFSSDTHVLSNLAKESEKVCRYDMDDLDTKWLEVFNENLAGLGAPTLSEKKMELIMEDFESQCFNKFQQALKTEKGLGIEYDENVTCDVCRLAECEEGNEMVFCDLCNICVHQACYGITAIPEGSWVCRTCALNVQPSCILCPNRGGAMKCTRSGEKWAHVNCALWIPEVAFVDAEKMEPIAKVSQIPPSRWALICTFCRERQGACIQCAVKQCKVAYHVTCAFENGVDMKAFFNETKEEDGVKLRSYCLKHTDESNEVSRSEEIVWRVKSSVKKEEKPKPVADLDAHSARIQKIREMEAVFFNYVNIDDTKVVCNVEADIVDFVFYYWKAKRTANFNKALLPTKMDESILFGKQPEDSLYARMKMFVHLRQDLERVRNLCYMVSRREKLRRSFFKVKEEIFMKQVEALKDKSIKINSKDYESILSVSNGDSVYDKVYSSKKYKVVEAPAEIAKENSDKKKLPSAARLPNPYAKRYFNGMRTRSRRQSSSAAETSTSDAAKVEVKNDDESLSSQEHVVASNSHLTRHKRRHSLPSPVSVKEEENLQQTMQSMSLSERPFPETLPLTASTPYKEDVKEEVAPEQSNIIDVTESKEKTTSNSTKSDSQEEKSKETVYNDIKNSPSQSDKENRVTHSKVRGRKSKTHVEAKNLDISKAIEELSIEEKTKGTSEQATKMQEFSQLKEESNLPCGRYEMRTRNRSTSVSQDEMGAQAIEKLAEQPVDPTENKKSAFHSEEKVLKTEDHHLLEHQSERNEDQVIKIIGKKFSPGRKVTFSIKRRTRPRFFRKVKLLANQKSDSGGNNTSISNNDVTPTKTDAVENEDDTVYCEYKMSLRRNGKVLFSPLKKNVLSSCNKHCFSENTASNVSQHLSRSSDREHTNNNKKRDYSQESNFSPEWTKSESLMHSDNSSSSPTRDLTSSPRLVIKLVKDPKKQQWQKEDHVSDERSFKVVRNDWDDESNPKVMSDEASEICEQQEHQPRYIMRSRSKPSSSTS